MDKYKDIQGIAKALYGHYCGQDECGKCKQPNCLSYIQAERIVNMGYGNISQALTDFVNKLNETIEKYVINVYSDFDTERYAIITSLINATLEEFKNERH